MQNPSGSERLLLSGLNVFCLACSNRSLCSKALQTIRTLLQTFLCHKLASGSFCLPPLLCLSVCLVPSLQPSHHILQPFHPAVPSCSVPSLVDCNRLTVVVSWRGAHSIVNLPGPRNPGPLPHISPLLHQWQWQAPEGRRFNRIGEPPLVSYMPKTLPLWFLELLSFRVEAAERQRTTNYDGMALLLFILVTSSVY